MEDFIKYPKIRRLNDLHIGYSAPGFKKLEGMLDDPGHTIYCQEKIDGANFRVFIKDNNIYFGTHHTIMDDDMEQSKHWDKCVSYVRNQLYEKDLTLLNGCILMGEAMIRHSIPYAYQDHPPVIFYDIWDTRYTRLNKWVHPDNVILWLTPYGLETVHMIHKFNTIDLQSPILDEDVPQSVYYNGKAEGIVYKNYATGQFAKHVRKEFKEENRKVFGGKVKLDLDTEALFQRILATSETFTRNDPEEMSPWISDDELHLIKKALPAYKLTFNQTEAFVAKYCTNPRIEKIVFKMIDEGEKLWMGLMKKLPHLVKQDLFEENLLEIIHTKHILDFNKLNKMIGMRCKAVLQQIIDNAVY